MNLPSTIRGWYRPLFALVAIGALVAVAACGSDDDDPVEVASDLEDRGYASIDRLVTTTDEAGGLTTYVYDANGNVLSVTTPEADTWTFSYDLMDRATGFTDPLGNGFAMAYDQLGRMASVTDENGG